MTVSLYRSHNDKIRRTARGIILRDGNILLIERWRNGIHYFSIPGGGIEAGESPEEAVVRELLEETSVMIQVGRLLYELHDPAGHNHKIYLCQWLSGEPVMPESAPEMQRKNADNRYDPTWVKLSDFKDLPFEYWQPLANQLAYDLDHGLPNEPIILAM